MAGINRYNQRRIYPQYQALSLDELAFPYAKQEQLQKEQEAKAANLGIKLDSRDGDLPYAQDLTSGYLNKVDQYNVDLSKGWNNQTKQTYAQLLQEKNYIMNQQGEVLARRKATEAQDLAHINEAEKKGTLSPRDAEYKRREYLQSFPDFNSDNPLAVPRPNFTKSYSKEEDLKSVNVILDNMKDRDIPFTVKADDGSTVNLTEVMIKENLGNYNELIEWAQRQGITATRINEALNPIFDNNPDRNMSLIQNYEISSGKKAFGEDDKLTNDAKQYINDINNSILDYAVASKAGVNTNYDRKILTDSEGRANKPKTVDQLVMGLRTIGANIDANNYFEFYSSLEDGNRKITELKQEMNALSDPRLKEEKQKEIDDLSAEVAYWDQHKTEITDKMNSDTKLDFVPRFDKTYNLDAAQTISDLEKQALKTVTDLGLSKLPYTTDNTSDRADSIISRNIEYAKALKQYTDRGIPAEEAHNFAIKDVNAMSNGHIKMSRYIKASGVESEREYWLKHRTKLEKSLMDKRQSLQEFVNDNNQLFVKETTAVVPIGDEKTLLSDYNNTLTDTVTSNPESFIVKGTKETFDNYLDNMEQTVEKNGKDYKLSGKRLSQITTSSGVVRVTLYGKDKDGNEDAVKTILLNPDEDISNIQLELANTLIKSKHPNNKQVGYEMKGNIMFEGKYNHANLLNTKKGDVVETTIKLKDKKVSFERAESNTYKLRLDGQAVSIKPVYDSNNQLIDWSIIPFDPKLSSLITYNEINKVLLALSE